MSRLVPPLPALQAPNGRAQTRIDAFTREWARAIGGTGQTTMTRTELLGFLRAQTVRLTAALRADPADLTTADAVGAALVEARLGSAQTLRATMAVIAERLLPCLGLDSRRGRAYTRARLLDVQAAVAAGYAGALREQTFREQERVYRALLVVQRRTQDDWWASEARFRAVFAGAGIAMAITDLGGHLIDANQGMADLAGCPVEELAGRHIRQFDHPDDPPELWAAFHELASGRRDHMRFDKRFQRGDGGSVWTDVSMSLIRDEERHPRYTVAMIKDITERRALQEQLHHQATHDPLTGLPNRVLFLQRLDWLFEAADPRARVGMCFLDLDGFKTVNDTLGHEVGDRLLSAVAGRLDGCVSRLGHLVARLGGDEFAVLLERPSGLGEATAVADDILDALRTPVAVDGQQLRISASVGVVERAVGETSPAELTRDADVTMYRAKAEGRGRWASFDTEYNSRAVARQALASALPQALARREFALDYQPLVRLHDGVLVGVEALVRWHHPSLGLLMPNKFIDLAEDTGMIVELGRWVLREACLQAQRWHEEHRDGAPFVSVNLSVRQVRERTIVAETAGILSETGLDVARLQLELTESAVMETTGEPAQTLHDLAALGARIAIDDFGTGYSNLAYLRHLPIRVLKLAGPFVEGLAGRDGSPDRVDQRIVAALVELAHTLDLTVTAEGVQTEAQANALRTLGCDTGQGWYFAHAGPPEKIEQLLRTRHLPVPTA
ncbi:MAG TPA: EAL domain-containing protein [Micromonosporaceae bacterium]|nr:EAL domain-containing protein [Micromonosporaceae bacterium]